MFRTWLILAQAALTAVTGVVLFVAPDAIPASFGLKLTPDAYLLCYFYGATELSLALSSFAALRLFSGSTLRATCGYFVAIHVTEGMAGAYAVAHGLPSQVIANSLAHFVIAALFLIVTLRQASSSNLNMKGTVHVR